MLARSNRLVSADDYRSTVRRGRRHSSPHVVAYVVEASDGADTRLGFIVAKTVGNAVARNLVRRRLKSIAHQSISAGRLGSSSSRRPLNIVIRALPGAAQADWVTLEAEVSTLLHGCGTAIGGSTSRPRLSSPSSASAESDTDTRTAEK